MTPPILAELHQTLVTEIPNRLRAYNGDEPAACLHFVYYDSHAPVGYIDLQITTESKRAELYAEDPSNLWDGWGEPGNVALGTMEGPLFDQVFNFICEDGKEEENMKLYHDTLASAALQINETLPGDIGNITDDFVIVLGDGSRWTGGCDPDDVLMCLPKDKREMLIKGGFWDERDRY